MKVYLAGPMTGHPDHNFPLFKHATADLRRRGWDVVSPAELNAGEELMEHTPQRRLKCMRVDLHALIECEAIALLPGWEQSTGATFEFEVARRLGLQIFFFNSTGHLYFNHAWYP